MGDLIYLEESERLRIILEKLHNEKLNSKNRDFMNSLKSKVLKDFDVLDKYIKLSKVIYRYTTLRDNSGFTYEYYQKCVNDLFDLYSVFGALYMKACQLIWNASRMRTSRLRKRISQMLAFPCLFLTLTFTDKTLDNTSKDTRRRYVINYLKSFDSYYIANIDFGRKNEREHYHAIICSDKIDYSSWHKYGAIKGEKVRNNLSIDDFGVISNESNERIAKYINKLTNHAIKETTKANRIIYSRNFNSLC